MPLISLAIEHYIKALTFRCNENGLFTRRRSPFTSDVPNTPSTGYELDIDFILPKVVWILNSFQFLDGWNGRLHSRWITRDKQGNDTSTFFFFPFCGNILQVSVLSSILSFEIQWLMCLPLCFLRCSSEQCRWVHCIYFSVHVRPREAGGVWQDRVVKVSAMSSGTTGNNEPSWAQ